MLAFASALQPLADSCKEGSHQNALEAIAFGAAGDPWWLREWREANTRQCSAQEDGAETAARLTDDSGPQSSFSYTNQPLGPRPGARRRRKDPKKSSDKRLLCQADADAATAKDQTRLLPKKPSKANK